jgi:HAD superfamily hydrolase (TIGR01509 family)
LTVQPAAQRVDRAAAIPKLVIFDCDGVLVDSEPIAARVLAELLGELGEPTTAEDCLRCFTGFSIAAVIRSIEARRKRPLPANFRERLRARDAAAFRAGLTAIDGVGEVVRKLPLAKCVASSGSLEKMRLTLSITGLLGCFEPHLFSAEMVARGKPAPDLFLLAAERMGVLPDACTVVEDSTAGIAAGRAAGMRVLGFAGGGHAGPRYGEMLRTAGANVVFRRMAELPRLLGLPPLSDLR